jgi:hypothetical protein
VVGHGVGDVSVDVLASDGSVVTAVYSSGAIGRLLPDDVIGLVKYAKQSG